MTDAGPTIETTYRTLYRIGYWCSLEAKCETQGPDEHDLFTHSVHLVLVGQFGHRMPMGYCIISQTELGDSDIWDEDGDTFPSLDAAIWAHAERAVKITSMPGRSTSQPMPHETWQGTVVTAFPDQERKSA